MTITHFFITRKNENTILTYTNKTLKMEKKSGRLSKVFLSTINMKTGIIHDKKHIYDTVDINQVNQLKYSLKSKTNNKYYCSQPISLPNSNPNFDANRDHAQEWEHFDLNKTKNIMLNGNVLDTLNKISE